MEKPLSVRLLPNGHQEVGIFLPDFLGLLSLVTGLFASSGVSIVRGKISTANRRAVDLFEVEAPDSYDWKNYERDLIELSSEMQGGAVQEVRAKIAQRIIHTLRERQQNALKDLHPIDLKIHRNPSLKETVLDIRSQDTPAFLYELTNALSLLEINIVRMEINTIQTRVRDRLWVTDNQGQKITSGRVLKALRWAVLLIKHFSHLLPYVPDPAGAMEQIILFGRDVFDRKDFSSILLTLKKPEVIENLTKILGSSRFLWEEFIRTQHESIFPILGKTKFFKKRKNRSEMEGELGNLLKTGREFKEKTALLNQYKDREMFRIDLRHLLEKASYLGEFAKEFSDLAEATVSKAYSIAFREVSKKMLPPVISKDLPSEGAVFALGKFGGRELGYASDLELLFVYSDNPDPSSLESEKNLEFYSELVRVFRGIIHARSEGVFTIDLNLRPHGEDGPLAVSKNLFCSYYSPKGGAWNFERQALIKLRWVAGSRGLQFEVEEWRDRFCYGDLPFDFGEVLHLRDRQKKELVQPGTYNAKFSEGSLLDIEYLVQTMQIVYGRKLKGNIRSPNTLKALHALWSLGILETETFQRLRAATVFLRGVVNALRVVHGNAFDVTIPPPSIEAFVKLARRVGFSGEDEVIRMEFQETLKHHREIASNLFQTRMGEFLNLKWETVSAKIPFEKKISSVSLVGLLRGDLPEESQRELVRIGFQDLKQVVSSLQRICPKTRHFEFFARVIDKSWDVWSRVASPDLSLKNLERLLGRLNSNPAFWERLDQIDGGLEILLGLFGGSRYLSEILLSSPKDLESVLKREESCLETTEKRLKALSKIELSIEELRQLRHRETLRIALAERIHQSPLDQVYLIFSRLAEFIIEKVMRLYVPKSNLCVLSMGKLGGEELNFSSDIDLMFLGPGGQQDPVLVRGIRDLVKNLSCGGLYEFLYRVDLLLRPYGNDGNLYLSASDTYRYYQKNADPWEFQALIKARPVAGRKKLGEKLIVRLDPKIYRKKWDEKTLEEIRNVKRRFEKDTLSKGEWDSNIKMGEGGIRDVEFTIQMLQLLNGHLYPSLKGPSTMKALEELNKLHLIDEETHHLLLKSYYFLRRIENCLQLFDNRQTFIIPKEKKKLQGLARGLGFFGEGQKSAGERFLTELTKTQKACRTVFEQVYFRG